MFDLIYLVIGIVLVFCFFYKHSKLDLDGSLFSGAQKSNYYRYRRLGPHLWLPRNNDPKLNIENIYKEAYIETKAQEYINEGQTKNREDIKPKTEDMPAIKMEQSEELEEVKTEAIEKNNLSEERNVDL